MIECTKENIHTRNYIGNFQMSVVPAIISFHTLFTRIIILNQIKKKHYYNNIIGIRLFHNFQLNELDNICIGYKQCTYGISCNYYLLAVTENILSKHIIIIL